MPKAPNMSPCFPEHGNNNLMLQGLCARWEARSTDRYTLCQPLGVLHSWTRGLSNVTLFLLESDSYKVTRCLLELKYVKSSMSSHFHGDSNIFLLSAHVWPLNREDHVCISCYCIVLFMYLTIKAILQNPLRLHTGQDIRYRINPIKISISLTGRHERGIKQRCYDLI